MAELLAVKCQQLGDLVQPVNAYARICTLHLQTCHGLGKEHDAGSDNVQAGFACNGFGQWSTSDPGCATASCSLGQLAVFRRSSRLSVLRDCSSSPLALLRMLAS